MRKLLSLLAILAVPAQAQQPNGTINAPIYATGYISQVGGTNVTTTIKSQPNHPTNLNIYTTGAISGTWSIQLPNPAFEGQMLSFNCGAAANAIAITSSDGSSIDSNLPTSCTTNGGFVTQFDLRSNIWRSLGSGYSANFRPFTGVASQWPWQLNADGTWTLKQPDASDVTFTQSGTGATPRTVYDKIAERISTADFGAKCDGTTDDTAAIQAAVNAAISQNKPLYIQPSATGCIVSQNGPHSYSLLFELPIEIIGSPGESWIRPAPTMANTVDVLYFTGSTVDYKPTVIDGVSIGNPLAATRAGHHAVVFDTLSVNQRFLRPQIRNSYFSPPASGGGYSVFAINSEANNPNGGFAYGTISSSYIGSGVSLIKSGDSITLSRNTFSGGTSNPHVYANLVNGAGGLAGNLELISNNMGDGGSQLVVDCSASVTVIGGEIEQAITISNSNNAMIDLNGGSCQIGKAVIAPAQLQANIGVGNPWYVRFGNVKGGVLQGARIATPADFPPILVTASAIGTVIKADNTWSGMTTKYSDLAADTGEEISVPIGSGGTSQILKRTSAGGAVTVAQLSPGELSTIAGNTFLGNVSNSTTNPVAAPLPSCTGSGSVMQYVLGTGWGCHAIVPADLPVATTSALGVVKTDGSTLANTAGAISVNATTINGTSCTPGSTCNVNASYTNSLGSDLTMPVAGTYVDGPSVAQGSTGTWFASGTVTLDDTTNSAVYNCKLWDGTTTIARATHTLSAASYYTSISLSGVITSPAGNLRISCNEQFQTTGVMKATDIDGATKASTITAVRIN